MKSKIISRMSIAAGLTAALLSSPVISADLDETLQLTINDTTNNPPLGFKGKRWTADNGCVYSRAGRPGETVWYLIINTSGGKECRRVIPQSTYDDNAYAGYNS